MSAGGRIPTPRRPYAGYGGEELVFIPVLLPGFSARQASVVMRTDGAATPVTGRRSRDEMDRLMKLYILNNGLFVLDKQHNDSRNTKKPNRKVKWYS
jgi:hypothetical protein